jgi:hypothetical protein
VILSLNERRELKKVAEKQRQYSRGMAEGQEKKERRRGQREDRELSRSCNICGAQTEPGPIFF